MTLDALIMLAGFFVAILPFLGFPIQIDTILLVAVGILIIALGIFVRRRSSRRFVTKTGSTFTEARPEETHDAQ